MAAKKKKSKNPKNASKPATVKTPPAPKPAPIPQEPFEYPAFRSLEAVAGEAGFEAFGRTEKDLLQNAALGLFSEMANTNVILPLKKVVVSLSGQKYDELLHKLLSEIVFLKDFNRIVFKSVSVRYWKLNNALGLEAELAGQPIEELASGVVKADIKAVTFHAFKVEPIGKGLKATVVLDI
jgi:SHS2 domain-containing protein